MIVAPLAIRQPLAGRVDDAARQARRLVRDDRDFRHRSSSGCGSPSRARSTSSGTAGSSPRSSCGRSAGSSVRSRARPIGEAVSSGPSSTRRGRRRAPSSRRPSALRGRSGSTTRRSLVGPAPHRRHDLEARRMTRRTPDSWNFPLLVHIAGAAVMFGAVAAAAVSTLAADRVAEPDFMRRLAFRSLLFLGLPAYIVMRIGAQWLYSKGFDDLPEDPAWLSIGWIVADLGLLVFVDRAHPRRHRVVETEERPRQGRRRPRRSAPRGDGRRRLGDGREARLGPALSPPRPPRRRSPRRRRPPGR